MWHGRVKFKVTWLANQHQRWQRTKPTTLLLAFSLTWILAQRHIDLYLCVFQEAWSLPLHWPSWWHHSAGALSAPSSLSFEPWVWRFNQKRVLGDKVENRMTNPLPDHLSLTLKPDPLLVNPLWSGPTSLWRPCQKTDAHKRWNEAGLPTEMRT